MIGTFDKVAYVIDDLLRVFKWTVAGILYHDNTANTNPAKGLKSSCYFEAEAVFLYLKRKSAHGDGPWSTSFDETTIKTETYQLEDLLKDVSMHARSK